MAWGEFWRPYVPVAQRRAKAFRAMDRMRKKGEKIQPVEIEGREIARTFWGRAWCEHMEGFGDYANRLPRGRTYVRNGSVCHLDIRERAIKAKVSGSEIYDIEISIKTLPPAKWKGLKRKCAGRVGSLLELIQGKLSSQVMAIVTDRREGVFPQPREISMDCSCPDYADLCKHKAAVLYGVGSRLDTRPEHLFLLRGVDPSELVGKEAARALVARPTAGKGRVLKDGDLAEVFGIDVAREAPGSRARRGRRPAR